MARQKTKWPGVYQRISPKHKHRGKPDICYDITYKVNDKKVWEKVGWRSEGYSAELAAQVRSERLRTQRHASVPAVVNRKLTMDQAWALYVKQHVPGLKDAATEISAYNKHIGPALGHLRMDQISAYDLEGIKADLTAKGYAPATVKHVLVEIRSIYNRLRDWNVWQGDNPVTKVKMPKVDNARWRWLTRDEAHSLLQEIGRRSTRWYMISLISLHCGLRAGEVFALQGQHLDCKTGIIQVIDPKHRSRQAYMTRAVKAVLLDYQAAPGEYVFKNTRGEQIREVSETIPRSVQELGLNKGVTDARGRVVFHTFRHTFASWLAMSGWPLYLLAELMGHSTLEMTRRYSHLMPSQKQTAVARLQEFFTAGQLCGQAHPPDIDPDLFDGIE